MNTRVRATTIALGLSAIAFAVTFAVWPAVVPATAPAAAQVLGYGLLAGECLALGAGLTFLLFAYPTVRRLPVSRRLALAAYVAVGFDLTNWWAHDHLHAVAARLDFDAFIWMTVAIEYVFHGGMIVLSAILALVVVRVLARAGTPGPPEHGLKRRIALVVIPIAVLSIPLSLAVFPAPQLPAGRSLPAAVLPLLLGMKLLEGLGLGAGIALLIFGRRLLRATPPSVPAVPALLATAWYLVNWWPHDNLHLVNGDNVWGLLGIEYCFHLTLMAAAGVLALVLLRLAAPRPAAGPTPESPAGTGIPAAVTAR